ncbi:MAG TPA: hypothetical protein VE197_11675, partial [Mycobacterium sp.]|nr:hypothetical protein [Mycobacterium sp.]
MGPTRRRHQLRNYSTSTSGAARIVAGSGLIARLLLKPLRGSHRRRSRVLIHASDLDSGRVGVNRRGRGPDWVWFEVSLDAAVIAGNSTAVQAARRVRRRVAEAVVRYDQRA